MQEITVDQLLSLAKRHARSISNTVFFISTSFVLMLAHGSAWASGTSVSGALWGTAVFVGLFFGSIAYLLIYFREGLSVTQDIWPVEQPVREQPRPQPQTTRERPPIPARAPSYAATAPVTTMLHQLEQWIEEHADWFDKVNWSGVARAVKRGTVEDTVLGNYMPESVLEGTEYEPGFFEVMEDIEFVIDGEWTQRAKEVFMEIGQELDPPTPSIAPPDFSRLTAVD